MNNLWENTRRAELEMDLSRKREQFLESQAKLDAHDENRADPPPTNTCNRCKLKTDIYCGRSKAARGFDPVYGHRLYNWSELPLASRERESGMPWRCGPKGRFFKSYGDA
jgi:hypothetical protein